MPHQLDHEKLDVYQIEVQFVGWSTDRMVELFDSPEVREDQVQYGIEDEDEDEEESDEMDGDTLFCGVRAGDRL